MRGYADEMGQEKIVTVLNRDRVRIGNTVVDYEIRRSVRRKKTVQITLESGDVYVMAPSKLPKREIQQIVLKKASWIIGRMSEAAQEAPPKRFVSGETLPYLGRDVRLVVEFAGIASPTVSLDHWTFYIAAPHGENLNDHASQIREAVVGWYQARAAEHLPAEVDRWWDRLGVGNKSRILIRNQRSRWGSCAHDGTLRFNWRMMMLDPSLVEYIVVHELAHLSVMNHSADFWNLVVQVLPDAQQRRRRLREAGKVLPL